MNENYIEIAKNFYNSVKSELEETELAHSSKFDRYIKEIAICRVTDKQFLQEEKDLVIIEIKKL